MHKSFKTFGCGVVIGTAIFGVSSASAQTPTGEAPAPAAPAPAPPTSAPVQPPPAAAPAPTPAPVPPVAPVAPAPGTPPEAPVPVPPPESAAPPAPAEPPAADPSPSVVEGQIEGSAEAGSLAPPPVSPIQLLPEEQPAAEPEPTPWYDKLEASAFIDGYFSFNANLPKPQAGKNRFRAFDYNNGFSLSWIGLDLSYQRESVGGTLDLRFGPTAERFAGEPDTSVGLHFVKQAFATWRITPNVALDLGKFNTVYGAEAAESHLNYNYTRGLLNWLAQPFHHTGLRANFDLTEQFWITALLVNGWNNSVDNNFGKTLGIQFSTAVPNASAPEGAPIFDAHLGYLVGPEQADIGVFRNFCDVEGETLNPRALACDTTVPETTNAAGDSNSDRPVDAGDANTAGLRHFIDLVVGVNPSPTVSFLFNFDYGFENVRSGPLELTYDDVSQDQAVFAGFTSESFWGVSAMGRLQFDPKWAGALRGELYSDPDGRATNDGDLYVFSQPDVMLYSGTLTLEYAPDPGFILRLDNRIDAANQDLFPARTRSYESAQFTSTLGFVVLTN